MFTGRLAAQEEVSKTDFKAIAGLQVTTMRQLFSERGFTAGREAGRKVGKLALEKLNFQELKIEVRKVAIKYFLWVQLKSNVDF